MTHIRVSPARQIWTRKTGATMAMAMYCGTKFQQPVANRVGERLSESHHHRNVVQILFRIRDYMSYKDR